MPGGVTRISGENGRFGVTTRRVAAAASGIAFARVETKLAREMLFLHTQKQKQHKQQQQQQTSSPHLLRASNLFGEMIYNYYIRYGLNRMHPLIYIYIAMRYVLNAVYVVYVIYLRNIVY